MRQLIIDLDDTDMEDEVVVEEVLRQMREGYTSGMHPMWEIRKGE